jgi:hypothetical protein
VYFLQHRLFVCTEMQRGTAADPQWNMPESQMTLNSGDFVTVAQSFFLSALGLLLMIEYSAKREPTVMTTKRLNRAA